MAKIKTNISKKNNKIFTSDNFLESNFLSVSDANKVLSINFLSVCFAGEGGGHKSTKKIIHLINFIIREY